MKKIVLAMIFVMSLCFSFLSFGSTGQEGMLVNQSSEQGRTLSYRTAEGRLAKNEWKQAWDCWYYFDEDGTSKQNTWAEIDGKWYYFDNWSIMLHDTTTPDGYQVGPDGAWITGTQEDVSIWIGTYKSDDGQIITVKSTDSNGINVTFSGYSEEGNYTQDYTLLFMDAEKKQAVYKGTQIDQDVYTLTQTGIEVKVEPSGGWKQGTYVKL